MEAINIVNLNGCIQVLGALYEDYPEEVQDLKNFPYDNTVSINLIYNLDADGNETSISKGPYCTTIHYCGRRFMDDYTVTLDKDGYYKFKKIILPTKQHLVEDLGIEDGVSYADLKDQLTEAGIYVNMEYNTSFIILAFNTDTEQIELAVFYSDDDYTDHSFIVVWKEIDFDDVLKIVNEDSTLLYYEKEYFSYDNLYKCFIEKASDLISTYAGNKDFCNGNRLCAESNIKKYSYEIQIRDYLWAAINVIKYCIENENYIQALKVLECVSSCSGVCDGIKTFNGSDCGCSN